MALFDRAIATNLKLIPKPIVRKIAARYVAGETLEEAVDEVRRLNGLGCMATLDLLGEAIRTEAETTEVVETYLRILEVIPAAGIDANISIKPTHFGLGIRPDLFHTNAMRVLTRAREAGIFVRIDMEDSPTTEGTLRGYARLREAGFDNTGVVLQAALRRTPFDVRNLKSSRPNIRLCKGVYVEPPEVAWQSYEQINASYLEVLEDLLASPDYYPAIATHDDPLVDGAEALLARYPRPRDRYEFQMLLGVRPELRERILAAGHRLRVYVPFGASWYAYCLRRIKENPKIAGYVTSEVLKNPMLLLKDESDAR